jgi:hypothetical protein
MNVDSVPAKLFIVAPPIVHRRSPAVPAMFMFPHMGLPPSRAAARSSRVSGTEGSRSVHVSGVILSPPLATVITYIGASLVSRCSRRLNRSSSRLRSIGPNMTLWSGVPSALASIVNFSERSHDGTFFNHSTSPMRAAWFASGSP